MDKSVDVEIETEKKTELDEDFKSNVACFRVPAFEEFDIAQYRKDVGMSQSEFAAEHDISLATLRKWERSVSKPTFDKALKKILSDWLKFEFGKVRHQ